MREKLLEIAWNDKNEMINIMETPRKLDGKRVGDIYDLNKKLIDLRLIPEEVEKEILVELSKASSGDGYGVFNQTRFLQWLGQNNLKKLANDLSVYNVLFKRRFLT